MDIEILHVRDPDNECAVMVWVDGVPQINVVVEDIDAGRGWEAEDWAEHMRAVEESDYSPAFKTAVLAEMSDPPGGKYIEGDLPERLLVKITNVYDDETITAERVVYAPAVGVDDEDELEDWAAEHLQPLTGTGRTEGDAGYFVRILEASDPALVGKKFEWGV